ncbi:hypothetical protein Hanom_Chr03g00252141 [Helianthus anomalus]
MDIKEVCKIVFLKFSTFASCSKRNSFSNSFFFERQIWITDGPLEYHRGTSRTTRSYPSPLGNNAYTPIQEKTQ